jgi:hypothetical protein
VGAVGAPTLLLPGLAVASAKDTSDGQCPFGPNSVQDTFKGWNTPRLGGGFVWIYDALDNRGDMCGGTNNLASYVKAINDALGASS